MKFDLFKSIFCVLAIAVAPIMLLMYTYKISDFEPTNTLSLSLSSRIENTLAHKTDALKAAVTSIATADKNRDGSTTKAVLKVDRAEDDTVPWPPIPDCMELRKNDPYPTKGTRVEGHDLCKAYSTGTNRTDCVYKHPEVVNYILFTNPPAKSVLNFKEYLSIYSVHKFYKPEKIIIHCNNKIVNNKYWELVKKLSTPVEQKHADRITALGRNHRKPRFITHEVDYFKVYTGLKEGGMFADFDVVVLNGSGLREMQSRTEIIMGRDNWPCARTCAGFISCVPGSPLMSEWLKSYENDYQPRWIYNAGEIPSRMLHSCIQCYDAIVDEDISDWDQVKNWGKVGMMNWKIKRVAHYMSKGFMKPFLPVREILKMSTPFAETVKYVLGDTVKDFEDAI